MLFQATLLSLSLASVAFAQSSLQCNALPASITSFADQNAITVFCRRYRGIKAKTTTLITTPTIVRTATLPSVTQTTILLTTTETTTTETTTTATTETIPATSTTIATVFSTAYLDNSGNTILFAKRDAMPTPLEKRQVVTKPTVLASYGRADLTKICSCAPYNVAATIIRTMAARPAISMITSIILRTVNTRTTTTERPVSTIVNNAYVTVTAAAPVLTNIVYSFIPSFDSCPPTYIPAFLCPEGTADALIQGLDAAWDINFVSCPVFANDGYSGTCLYWNDDGSPEPATLTLGITGDPTQDATRAATYGSHANDDCPSWSDYTCSSGATTLTALPSSTAVAKRAITKRAAGNTVVRTHTKQKMPARVVGTRGAKYVHTGKL